MNLYFKLNQLIGIDNFNEYDIKSDFLFEIKFKIIKASKFFRTLNLKYFTINQKLKIFKKQIFKLLISRDYRVYIFSKLFNN